jgi:hypothetical protein
MPLDGKTAHHGGDVCVNTCAVFPYSGMVSIDEHTSHPLEPLWKGLDEASIEGFSIKF